MESPESRPHRIVVTLCTYNERENISRLIPAILQVLPTVDVLVVDDSSPDGTAEVASELGKRDRRVKLLLRTAK
ncbi:MAG: glycosyltransferase, partial [Planctomycetes bacterium]|nr:glycosyltransferase [Planctomycetota bacterium]